MNLAGSSHDERTRGKPVERRERVNGAFKVMPPSGWYPDPWRVASWRWWDGRQWSAHTAAAASASYFGPPRPDPAVALASELRMWRWARGAVWTWLTVELVQLAAASAVYHRVFSAFRKAIDTARSNPNAAPPVFPFSGGVGAAAIALNLLSLLTLVAAIAFLIWQYSAAQTALDLGYPARRSPALGVVSWLIPIINLWFPYQAMRDLLPPHHPGRPAVLHAWLAYLASEAFASIAVVTALFFGLYTLVPLALARQRCNGCDHRDPLAQADHRRPPSGGSAQMSFLSADITRRRTSSRSSSSPSRLHNSERTHLT
ncbi:MAG: DUF4328 domain-containing protein [Acidimicrobiales bacterium]